jgi:beta-galactosidase
MGLPSPHDESVLLHRYCYERGIACGFIHPEDDLSRLKVLYVPHWLMWSDEWTKRIETFAQNGGTVILAARTGTRDRNNHVIRQAAPGTSLSALAGVTVDEFGLRRALSARGAIWLERDTTEVPGGVGTATLYSSRWQPNDSGCPHV